MAFRERLEATDLPAGCRRRVSRLMIDYQRDMVDVTIAMAQGDWPRSAVYLRRAAERLILMSRALRKASR